MKKANRCDRVCYVGTIYTLFLYLMHSSIEEINRTLFCIAPGIPKDIMRKLPNYLDLDESMIKQGFWGKLFISRFYLAWIYHKYVKFKISRIAGRRHIVYAQDHFDFSATIIGSNEYTLIEDSAHIFSSISQAVQKSKNTYFEKIWNYRNLKFYPIYKFLYGKALYGIMGRNILCTSVLLSEEDDDDFIASKKHVICDFNIQWERSSINKKKMICEIFDVTNDDIDLINQSEVIIFTQNIFNLKNISKDKQIYLYKKIADNYKGSNILFKLHPRDNIDYEKYIHNIGVYKKKIPSQLFYLIGTNVKVVATIYSSAVYGAPESVRIDWYGVDICEEIKSSVGFCSVPSNANLCVI